MSSPIEFAMTPLKHRVGVAGLVIAVLTLVLLLLLNTPTDHLTAPVVDSATKPADRTDLQGLPPSAGVEGDSAVRTESIVDQDNYWEVFGTVRNGDGTPVLGAEIRLFSNSDGKMAQGLSDLTGSYAARFESIVLLSLVTISVGSSSFTIKSGLPRSAGETRTQWDITMPDVCTVKGRLVISDSHLPFANAAVRIVSPQRSDCAEFARCLTKVDGTFELRSRMRGTCILEVLPMEVTDPNFSWHNERRRQYDSLIEKTSSGCDDAGDLSVITRRLDANVVKSTLYLLSSCTVEVLDSVEDVGDKYVGGPATLSIMLRNRSAIHDPGPRPCWVAVPNTDFRIAADTITTDNGFLGEVAVPPGNYELKVGVCGQFAIVPISKGWQAIKAESGQIVHIELEYAPAVVVQPRTNKWRIDVQSVDRQPIGGALINIGSAHGTTGMDGTCFIDKDQTNTHSEEFLVSAQKDGFDKSSVVVTRSELGSGVLLLLTGGEGAWFEIVDKNNKCVSESWVTCMSLPMATDALGFAEVGSISYRSISRNGRMWLARPKTGMSVLLVAEEVGYVILDSLDGVLENRIVMHGIRPVTGKILRAECDASMAISLPLGTVAGIHRPGLSRVRFAVDSCRIGPNGRFAMSVPEDGGTLTFVDEGGNQIGACLFRCQDGQVEVVGSARSWVTLN